MSPGVSISITVPVTIAIPHVFAGGVVHAGGGALLAGRGLALGGEQAGAAVVAEVGGPEAARRLEAEVEAVVGVVRRGHVHAVALAAE